MTKSFQHCIVACIIGILSGVLVSKPLLTKYVDNEAPKLEPKVHEISGISGIGSNNARSQNSAPLDLPESGYFISASDNIPLFIVPSGVKLSLSWLDESGEVDSEMLKMLIGASDSEVENIRSLMAQTQHLIDEYVAGSRVQSRTGNMQFTTIPAPDHNFKQELYARLTEYVGDKNRFALLIRAFAPELSAPFLGLLTHAQVFAMTLDGSKVSLQHAELDPDANYADLEHHPYGTIYSGPIEGVPAYLRKLFDW